MIAAVESVAACDDAQLEVIGRSVDRQITVEMRLGAYSRGVATKLHAAALAAQRTSSLALLGARALRDRVRVGDVVLIATGAGHADHMPRGETDGPLGAVALARVLQAGLGASPIFVSAAEYAHPIEAAAAVAGLPASVLSFPSDGGAAAEAQEELIRLAPAAVIAIEVLAPNRAGVAHTASGLPSTAERPRIEALFGAAAERGILTIGIGDNGNEIGFGVVEDAVREHKPFGDECRCPCAGGIASVVTADVLVAANISNWGAYGIEAMLAALLGQPHLVHDGELERRLLDAAVEAGAIDGSTGKRIRAVDGAPVEVHEALLRILRAIVENGLTTPPERGF